MINGNDEWSGRCYVEHGFDFSIHLGMEHHPNWRTHSLHDFTEGYVNHQPDILLTIIKHILTIINHH
jgi:hypothetical protein